MASRSPEAQLPCHLQDKARKSLLPTSFSGYWWGSGAPEWLDWGHQLFRSLLAGAPPQSPTVNSQRGVGCLQLGALCPLHQEESPSFVT